MDRPRLWPVFSLIAASVAALNPIGLKIIGDAYFSGEQLTRNIWQPLVQAGVVIVCLAGVIETAVRAHLRRRATRRKGNLP